MSRKAKGSGFKMKSGNSPLFKEMGSSPLLDIVDQTRMEADASLVGAAKTARTIEPIDYTIDIPDVDFSEKKKKEKEESKECPEGQISDGEGGCIDDPNNEGEDNEDNEEE